MDHFNHLRDVTTESLRTRAVLDTVAVAKPTTFRRTLACRRLLVLVVSAPDLSRIVPTCCCRAAATRTWPGRRHGAPARRLLARLTPQPCHRRNRHGLSRSQPSASFCAEQAQPLGDRGWIRLPTGWRRVVEFLPSRWAGSGAFARPSWSWLKGRRQPDAAGAKKEAKRSRRRRAK